VRLAGSNRALALLDRLDVPPGLAKALPPIALVASKRGPDLAITCPGAPTIAPIVPKTETLARGRVALINSIMPFTESQPVVTMAVLVRIPPPGVK
jgi:hypothetical protein